MANKRLADHVNNIVQALPLNAGMGTPPDLPNFNQPGGDEATLKELLQQLNAPLLQLPPEPQRSNLQKFSLATAGATNPTFVQNVLGPELASRRAFGERQAAFEERQLAQRGQRLQALAQIQALQEHRRALEADQEHRRQIDEQNANTRAGMLEVQRHLAQTRAEESKGRLGALQARVKNMNDPYMKARLQQAAISQRRLSNLYQSFNNTFDPDAKQTLHNLIEEENDKFTQISDDIEARLAGQTPPAGTTSTNPAPVPPPTPSPAASPAPAAGGIGTQLRKFFGF